MLSRYRPGLSSAIHWQTPCAKALASFQVTRPSRHTQRHHDVKPLAAGGLAEAFEAENLEPLFMSFAASMTSAKSTFGAGSRSNTSRPGTSVASGAQFQGCSSSPPICATAASPSMRSICKYGLRSPETLTSLSRFDVLGMA